MELQDRGWSVRCVFSLLVGESVRITLQLDLGDVRTERMDALPECGTGLWSIHDRVLVVAVRCPSALGLCDLPALN